MITVLLACVLGAAVGGVLGVLGGGGAILTVPILVYLLGQSAAEATTASLVIVGAAAVSGAVSHRGDGLVRWRLALAVAAVGSGAAWSGSLFNRQLDHRVLLLCFGAVMLAAAAAVAAATRSAGRRRVADETAGAPGTTGRVALSVRPRRAVSIRTRRSIVIRAAAAGLALGFLTGFLGVGGGFLVVPALMAVFGLPLGAAAATSLVVIAVNSAVSLVARIGHLSADWTVLVPLTVAAVIASTVGSRLARRVPVSTLSRVFAAVLLALGVTLIVQNATALVG